MARCFTPRPCQALAAGAQQRLVHAAILLSRLSLVTAFLSVSAISQTPAGSIPDYSKGPSWFPRVFAPYQAQKIPEPALENPASLSASVEAGLYRLSLRQLLRAVAENNLDIASSRYDYFVSTTDVLRTRSGQPARGTTLVRVPRGLGGAIGGGAGGGAFVPNVARALSVGPRGSLDPSLGLNFSMDNNSLPQNTTTVSGVRSLTVRTTALQLRYTQAFTSGTSFSFGLTTQRQSSTSRNLRFNPSLSSSFNLSVNQQLLSGLGFAVNRRFMKVAETNTRVARQVFRQPAILALTNAQNLYWDLVAAREQVRAAEQAATVAERLAENNRKQAEIGTLAPLDVVAADAEVAARRRDLIAAQTNEQVKELQLKNVISREIDAALGAARIEATDALPQPQDSDVPAFEEALATALQNRPELAQAQGAIQNQEVAVQFTRRQLLPSFGIFGVLGSAARTGTLGGALTQLRGLDFPEYAFGFALNIPILNRAAQADNSRAQLEMRQMETSLQRAQNQIRMEVRNAIIALLQARSQVEATRKVLELRRQSLDAEEKKLQAGVSTPYNVIQLQRDSIAAEFAEVQARANYAKARVSLDQIMGVTLEKHGIALDDLLREPLSASASAVASP